MQEKKPIRCRPQSCGSRASRCATLHFAPHTLQDNAYLRQHGHLRAAHRRKQRSSWASRGCGCVVRGARRIACQVAGGGDNQTNQWQHTGPGGANFYYKPNTTLQVVARLKLNRPHSREARNLTLDRLICRRTARRASRVSAPPPPLSARAGAARSCSCRGGAPGAPRTRAWPASAAAPATARG
eukprot:scaffold92729_cov66-Phaeocystis_antarctica.AAC.1